MSTHAHQAISSPACASAVRNVVTFYETVTVTDGYGAPSLSSDDPGVTISRSDTGDYSLTYPNGKKAWIQIILLSPAATVSSAILTALDATAGTATFTVLSGTSATDPASGDSILLTITVEL